MESEAPHESKTPRRIRLTVGVIVILAALDVLLWLGLGWSPVCYRSVSEFIDGRSLQNIRVAGGPAGGSSVDDGQGTRSPILSDRERPLDELIVANRATP